MKEIHRIVAFKGDLATTIDAELIARHGVEVVPINIGKECHLEANLGKKALQKIDLTNCDLSFIENVGNRICPAEFPLGSEKRIIVISVTEGRYMVLKHSFIFIDADVLVINKIDLAQAMKVDVKKLEMDVTRIKPTIQVVEINCRDEIGIQKVVEALHL